jgi:hypothetical protein
MGGAMTLIAQRWALSHDREKEETRRTDEQRAFGWSIFFKTLEAFEAMSALSSDVESARLRASAQQEYLWQTLQFPPHDWDVISSSDGELLFLIEKRELEIMQRYQQALRALSNVVQSVRLYREMRVEFLMSTPSDMRGVQGAIEINDANRKELLPRIAHLATLSESLAEVIARQRADTERLLMDYTAAMKRLVGERPELVMRAAKKAGPSGSAKPHDAGNQAAEAGSAQTMGASGRPVG